MERTKRIFTFLTFFVCTACLAALSASLATNKWVSALPVRVSLINGSDLQATDRAPRDRSDRKFRGEISFGLFQGSKTLNYGFGDRNSQLWIKEELMKNPNLMPFGLWMSTVLCVALAMLFGLVSSIFAVINTVMTPIEVITGLQGLFLWNGMGALFCTGACISWLIQFRSKLRRNVLTNDEIKDGWTSENRAWLGYSFFLVVGALGLFLLNVLLVALASRRPRGPRNKTRPQTDKNPEGVIMLY
jgi:hypothetical protein